LRPAATGRCGRRAPSRIAALKNFPYLRFGRVGRDMKSGLWKKWTVDKPAAFGDWLWDVLVVQLAAWLDRLTLRKVIAFIPVAILVFAYMHSIPLPPELMLVGDLLAYIDVFAMVFLLGLIGRAGLVVYALKRAIEFATRSVSNVLTGLRRLNFRHRRASGAGRRKRGANWAKQDDGDYGAITAGALSFA
jgi:hypothetical protein